ncbi:immunoglobulin superfamily member 5 isoform X2 [Leuresthes tenuis]|uniref:immunoglobulin superfamily member 5 isoform X2 n=1 Tax=Leuresthes tenuis TaxID=355514 RepID=UPI003B513C11
MDILSLLVLLLSYRIEGVGAKMKLSPESLTVVRGDEASFTCSPSNSAWTVMVWLLNGRAVLTISKETGVLPSIHPNVTAVLNKDGWRFVMKNTERDNEGQVTCDLQLIDRRTANLFVQEKGSVTVFGDNRLAFKGQSVLFQCQAAGWYPHPIVQWQVDHRKVSQNEYNVSTEDMEKSLFTVTSNLSIMAAKSSRVDCLASVSALKTPLKSSINLTVEANPQEPMRFDLSAFGRSSVAATTGGKVNLGYSGEGPAGADYDEVTLRARCRADLVSFNKAPDVVHSSGLSVHSESHTTEFEEEESIKNVRRITTV